MPAIETSGSQVCTVTTEHTLATPTTAKTRTLTLDFNASVGGDVFEVGVQTHPVAAGTDRVLWLAVVAHVLAAPIVQSPPVVMPDGGKFTLKQTAGTSRTIPWSVTTLD